MLIFLTFPNHLHSLTRPRLKNIDRSSAQHLEVTVGDLTVIITDFKEKAKPTSTSATSSSAASTADHHSQNGSSSENTEKGLSRSSSPRGEGSSVNGESHWVTRSWPHPPGLHPHLIWKFTPLGGVSCLCSCTVLTLFRFLSFGYLSRNSSELPTCRSWRVKRFFAVPESYI